MDYRLKRITPWMHTHAIASILGMVLFVFATEAFLVPMAVGTSSYFIAIGLMWDPVSNLLGICCLSWFFVLPICTLVFYILFLWKKFVIPYLVLVGLDTLIVLGWFIYALCTGNGYGAVYIIPDVIATVVMAMGMAVAFFRKPF